MQGIGKLINFVPTPTPVEFFNDKAPIQDVQAGEDHTVVLLKDGSLYTMGDKACCGKASAKNNFFSPVLVSIGNGIKISSICCSWACTIVQTVNEEWYAFGDSYIQCKPAYGKAVSRIPERIDDVFPKTRFSMESPNVDYSKPIQVKKLVATTSAFFILTSNDKLYTVGTNKNGEMGIDKQNLLEWTLCRDNVLDIQVGLNNSFLFEPKPFLLSKHTCQSFTDICIQNKSFL